MRRIMVTGASGPLGKEIAEQVIQGLPGSAEQTFDFLLCQARYQEEQWLRDYDNKAWVVANLDEVGVDWWRAQVEDNNIDCIIFVETIENSDTYIPTPRLLSQFREQEATFLAFCNEYYVDAGLPKLQIVYTSTDRIYMDDKFPNELNPVMINQPEDQGPDINLNYAALKLGSELALTSSESIDPRIIRPFNLTWRKQGQQWPLASIVIKAINNNDIDVYGDGRNGYSFTAAEDFASFVLKEELFTLSPDNSDLSARIINVCRTENYLPEEYLHKKIINKTDSDSKLVLASDVNIYTNTIQTPQIRNQSLIWNPRIPIEVIIEQFILELDPVYGYDDLVVTNYEYTAGNFLTFSGSVEPLSGITILLENGDVLSTDADEDGSWAIISPEPINYTDWMRVEVYATSPEAIQYMTVLLDLEPAVVLT